MNNSSFIPYPTSWTALSEKDVITASKVLKTLAYAILFLTSLTGNSLIIWVIRKDTRLRSTTNILVANMAVSDLLISIFAAPRQIIFVHYGQNRWLIEGAFGLVLCKLAYFMQDVSMVVSSFSIVAIATDRYLAVTSPIQGGFQKKKLKFIIPGIWILAGGILTPYLVSFRLIDVNNITYCTMAWSSASKIRAVNHITSMIVICYAIPLLVTLVFYVIIAKQMASQIHPGNPSPEAIQMREQRNKNIAKLSAAIVTVFFLFWAPTNVFVSIHIYLKIPVSQDYVFAFQFLAETSCAINFFIYLKFNAVYRENFKNILKYLLCCV